MPPLIRLRVDHSDYPVIAGAKITSIYSKADIANLEDCVFFRRREPKWKMEERHENKPERRDNPNCGTLDSYIRKHLDAKEPGFHTTD